MHPCAGRSAIANWPPLCCLPAKILRVTCVGHDLGHSQSTTILTQWGSFPPRPTSHGADFGTCHDHTAALSGRARSRPEGSTHRTTRPDCAMVTPDLRGDTPGRSKSAWGPIGRDRSPSPENKYARSDREVTQQGTIERKRRVSMPSGYSSRSRRRERRSRRRHGRMASVNGANTEDRGPQGGRRWRREATLTTPAKWVNLGLFGPRWDRDGGG